MSQLILSIDQGTTGTKATLFEKNGKVFAQAYAEFPQLFPKPGWVEHRAEDILRSVEQTVSQVVSKMRKTDQIAALGITNQRETVFAWDRDTGEALSPGIVWQCRRTAPRCEEIKRTSLAEGIRKKTGLPCDAYFSATKMEWLLQNNKKVERAREKKKLAFSTVDSYLLAYLTSFQVHKTEPSNASRTMLFNIYTGEYDPFLLQTFHLPLEALPEVVPSAGFFGETKGLSFLPDGIPVTGILGDQQAALFGQGCFEPGTAKNTYGTGAFVLMNTGTKPFSSKKGLVTTIAWQIGKKRTYALEGSIFVCGAAIQWLRDNLHLIATAQETEELARSVPDSGGVVFVPALAGLGAPYWDPYARGAILGITRATSRAHLVRATLESMALQVQEVLEVMQKETKIPLRCLKVDGGASSNNFLLQLQSNLLGKEVLRGTQEATSLGAAWIAALGAGLFRSQEELKRYSYVERKFIPQRDKALAPLQRQWKKGIARAQGWVEAGK